MTEGKKVKNQKDAPAEKAKDPEVVAPVVEPTVTSSVESEPTWNVATWMEVSKAKVGVEPYVIAGALTGQNVNREYSEREIRSLVEKFLRTPVR